MTIREEAREENYLVVNALIMCSCCFDTHFLVSKPNSSVKTIKHTFNDTYKLWASKLKTDYLPKRMTFKKHEKLHYSKNLSLIPQFSLLASNGPCKNLEMLFPIGVYTYCLFHKTTDGFWTRFIITSLWCPKK